MSICKGVCVDTIEYSLRFKTAVEDTKFHIASKLNGWVERQSVIFQRGALRWIYYVLVKSTAECFLAPDK